MISKATRKLTTILAADVVGYSRQMATDEERTMETLRTCRTVFEALVAKHEGRIFSTAGDAILAEFSSTVEAVRCAIAIQEELRARNAQLGENEQMWFRIGINVGDVMAEGDDLFGDGVNVAARLEKLAHDGGICISGSAFEQVKNKLSVAFADIGPQRVKNIPEPVSAFRVVPGQVSVKTGDEAALSGGVRQGWRAGLRTPRIALPVAVAVVAAGGATVWLLANRSQSVLAFDGRWDVSVESRTGCPDNAPTAYSIMVVDGVIDEPRHRLPKKGSILPDGTFEIEVTSPDGRRMNVQSGAIRGDVGKGRFMGARPGCTGDVTIRRTR